MRRRNQAVAILLNISLVGGSSGERLAHRHRRHAARTLRHQTRLSLFLADLARKRQAHRSLVGRRPPAGGTLRPSGAHFAFVSGRPYRWDHAALRTNVHAILADLFDEPKAPTESLPPPQVTRFLPPVPNPFNPSVQLGWELAAATHLRIQILSLGGRLVRTLVDEPRLAGRNNVVWDGRDGRGERCASGLYVARFEADGVTRTTKLTLLR